ncbi:sulfite exporter TauE/SafE family protein [archaeon]|jgi:uncharacterized protein|nr:sulfite exporter TauE/SafE family protein [archaeon]
MVKKEFKIKGMTCNSCASIIEDGLKNFVKGVDVNFSNGVASVYFDEAAPGGVPSEGKISEEEIVKKIEEMGYSVVNGDNVSENSNDSKIDFLPWIILIGSVGVLLYVIYNSFLSGLDLGIPEAGESGSLILLFFVGILTGFHCISMCGGFVVSYTTKNAMKGHKSFMQHFVYGGSRVLSYAIIGGLFGLIGGVIAFSVGLRGWIAIFAGVFMIFYSMSMFGFKWFRRFQFNPKFLTKFNSRVSKNTKGVFMAPLVTGLLSGLFIACGPLQAMYLYAMGSGNFVSGFLSLGVFGLGTLPVMIGFGSFATVISHKATKRILKISAILVLILGLIMLNRGLLVIGSDYSYEAIKAKVVGVEGVAGEVRIEGGYQIIDMEVTRSGWNPDVFVLKKGVPVKWNIDVKELTGCNNEIIVGDYNLDIKLKKGMNVVEFTPDKSGNVQWSCWMGMIPGSFVVTDDGSASASQITGAVVSGSGSGGGCGGGADGGGCGSPTCGGSSGGGCGCGG